nr:MAG TPA: hypothetical protein [Caudoviricetes sp.]
MRKTTLLGAGCSVKCDSSCPDRLKQAHKCRDNSKI